jgi:hypothetical protein
MTPSSPLRADDLTHFEALGPLKHPAFQSSMSREPATTVIDDHETAVEAEASVLVTGQYAVSDGDLPDFRHSMSLLEESRRRTAYDAGIVHAASDLSSGPSSSLTFFRRGVGRHGGGHGADDIPQGSP